MLRLRMKKIPMPPRIAGRSEKGRKKSVISTIRGAADELAWRLLNQKSEVRDDGHDGNGDWVIDDGDCGSDWRTGYSGDHDGNSIQSQDQHRDRKRASPPRGRFSPATPGGISRIGR